MLSVQHIYLEGNIEVFVVLNNQHLNKMIADDYSQDELFDVMVMIQCLSYIYL